MAVCLLSASAAEGAPPKPFDPRPLMQAVRERVGDGPFTFAVFGDSKNNPPFWELLRYVDRRRPDFVLTTGDLVDRGGGARGQREYGVLAERGGWFLRKYATWPVPGNHELAGGSGARAAYERFFGIPAARYAFKCGRATFIALDWPTPVRGGLEWLERQLIAAGGGPTFVVLHDVLYTVGSKAVPNRSTALTRLLTRYRVTAVLQGHDHGYYRTRRDDVWYLTSAGAGAAIYVLRGLRNAKADDVFYGRAPSGAPVPAGSYWLRDGEGIDRVFRRPVPFSLFITVDGDRVTGRTLAVDGTVWDEFELRARAESRKEPAPRRRTPASEVR